MKPFQMQKYQRKEILRTLEDVWFVTYRFVGNIEFVIRLVVVISTRVPGCISSSVVFSRNDTLSQPMFYLSFFSLCIRISCCSLRRGDVVDPRCRILATESRPVGMGGRSWIYIACLGENWFFMSRTWAHYAIHFDIRDIVDIRDTLDRFDSLHTLTVPNIFVCNMFSLKLVCLFIISFSFQSFNI